MDDEQQRLRTTYRHELLRAVSAGILETAGSTFLLTIAVKFFEAGAFSKAIVAGAGSLGLLLSPVVVTTIASIGWPTGKAASRILAIGALSFLMATLLPRLPVFVVCCVLGMTSSAAIIPLLTQMYQDNYPERERGRLFSRTMMIRIATAAIYIQQTCGRRIGWQNRKVFLAAARVRTCAGVRKFLPVAVSDKADSIRWRCPPAPSSTLCAQGRTVSANVNLLDADGLRKSDDAAAACRVSRESQLPAGESP